MKLDINGQVRDIDVDVAHPAHVHLFRNLIGRVRREGGEVLADSHLGEAEFPGQTVNSAAAGAF